MQSVRSTAAGGGMPEVATFRSADGTSMSVVALPPQRTAPPSMLPPATPRPMRRASMPMPTTTAGHQPPSAPRRVFDFVQQAEQRQRHARLRGRACFAPPRRPSPASAWVEEAGAAASTAAAAQSTTATVAGTPSAPHSPPRSPRPSMHREATRRGMVSPGAACDAETDADAGPQEHLPAVRQRARPSVVVVNGHHDYVSYRRTQQGAAQFRAQGAHGGGHGTPGGSLAGTDADSVTVDAIQLRHRLQKLSDSIPRVSSPHMTRRLRQRRSALGKGAPADKQDTHCWLGPRSVA